MGLDILLLLVILPLVSSHVSNMVEEVSNWIEQMHLREDQLPRKHVSRNLNRKLRSPTRACGEIIGKVYRDQIDRFANVVIDVLVPPGSIAPVLVEAFKNVVLNELTYDFMAIKVCMSCQDVTPSMLSSQSAYDNSDEYGFASYCGPDSYASDAVSFRMLMFQFHAQHLSLLIFFPFRLSVPFCLLQSTMKPILLFLVRFKALFQHLPHEQI